MDVLCLDDSREGSEGKSVSSDVDANFEDPEVVPRVGDQYQAELPPIVTSTCSSQLMNEFRDFKLMMSSLELPIILKRACSKAESCRETLESFIKEEGQVISAKDSDQLKVEPHSNFHGEGKNATAVLSFQSSFKCDEMEMKLDDARDMHLILEFPVESWTDIEYDSFLLGLYIFGKNFNFVKRFVGSKKMGHILSFYYGKFYRSENYRRWSQCRKLRNKRCIFGQKIFTGWRQQELLSRLFSHVSTDCQNTLIEVFM